MYRSLLVLAVLGACGDNKATSPDAGPPGHDAPASADAGVDAPGAVDFTETYEAGTQDVGNWILSTNPNRPRTIETSGGNPGGYLYSEVATAIPSWSVASPRFQPGVNDEFKRDSVFNGDYYTAGIKTLSADLEVIQAGSWTPDRTVTLHLMGWDDTNDSVTFDATYSVPDIVDPPVGWNNYSFTIDAQSPTIPTGWTVNRGDGTPATDADWATFMHQVDLVEFGFWKPGYAYPSLGEWHLGIDNVHISALP